MWNNGKNTVLTGAAGTGKTWTIENKIVNDDCITALTGMTGLASCNLKGQTIHSWLNLGLIRPDMSLSDNGLKGNINRIVYNRKADWRSVKRADVLVIDEISMCDALTLDIIDGVLKHVRKNNNPFGGMQVVLVGDNFQLPPVKLDLGFYFQSKAYKNGGFIPFILKEQHRQQEGEFLNILNRIRVGEHTQEDIDLLNTRQVDKNNVDLPKNTMILYPTNKQVDFANEFYFNSIEGDEEYFYADDETYLYDKDYSKNIRVPNVLTLKEGCKVLLLANINVSKGIVNGSHGVYLYSKFDKLVCRFNDEIVEVPKQKFEVYDNNELAFTRSQYPIMLGHSISIHKSQGMTLDNVFIDFTNTFSAHQVYVALSRVKTLEGLYINNLSKEKIWVHRLVKKYMQELES